MYPREQRCKEGQRTRNWFDSTRSAGKKAGLDPTPPLEMHLSVYECREAKPSSASFPLFTDSRALRWDRLGALNSGMTSVFLSWITAYTEGTAACRGRTIIARLQDAAIEWATHICCSCQR